VSVYAACMATKTISIDMEAYETLKRARRTEKDSFSQVIKRAKWEAIAPTCGALLEALVAMPTVDEKTVRYWEKAQREDAAPDDPWS
jgi:Putative antitoxin